MVNLNSKQMVAGKSFEYAILSQFNEKLNDKTTIQIIKNSSYDIAKGCFDSLEQNLQSEYLLSASFAVNFLIDIEPRLSNDLNKEDILQLEILSDDKGKAGDVRDVLAIRALQKWEIGVSAKNNHDAVKHSRLSSKINFGEKWFGLSVSEEYFQKVNPIFDKLSKIRSESNAKTKWSELGDYNTNIYVPILNAFIEELNKLNEYNPKDIASNLVSYLVGNKDFYKVIKTKKSVEVHAYNIHGTLNLPFQSIKPKYVTPRIQLPTKISKVYLKEDSKTTAIVELDNDWALSFRIHNASSRVEASLKFDINLLKAPNKLFKNSLSIPRGDSK
jgi:hypothetical protein